MTQLLEAHPESKRIETDLPDDDGLSDAQREFVRLYLIHGSATKAATIMGLPSPRCSGPRILKNDAVRKTIYGELRSKKIDDEHVIAELSELCYAKLADFMDEQGDIDIEKVRANSHLVKKYKVKQWTCKDGSMVTTHELELHDRHAALVDVGKTFRMFGDNQTVNNFTLVMTDLQREMAPLLAECLDPAKRERFAQGLAALALKHGHQAPVIETAASVIRTLPPIEEKAVDAVAVNVEPQKQPSTGGNGNNGHNGHEVGT